MALRLLDGDLTRPVDRATGIWQDDTTGDPIIQSYSVDGGAIDPAQAVGSSPGHSTAPQSEAVIRLPAYMLSGEASAPTRT
ncbi:hypothetical protein [Streptomyces sp. ITFR-16]|uniref:hypothetical protein n=1 Tax=Streptomyces sp. ITFR-16 TaxID=3075198 RepID=UPI00288B3279|nr:hypothetical protein [Streptomyces sp. ITFR-16]WNI22864.1 hypothetical protein RLT58_13415 [Streptomyces sp. ITFR-16]